MKSKLKLAACGLDCNACNLYKAAFDDAAAAALVDWFRQRGWIGEAEGAEAIRRKTPLCLGCWTKTGPCWCGDCSLRACCEDNARNDCGECPDFPCASYRAWTVGQAHHQAAMAFLADRSAGGFADFEHICAALSLGALTAPPVPLSGGYTHRMFRLDTDKGTYAVKLLNPEIMQRPDAPDNYSAAEKGERLLEAAGVPILPARTIGGRKMQCVNGQYLYVFDFFDGRVLPMEAITPAHCAKIGAALARIHGIDRRACTAPLDSPLSIDWAQLAADLLSSADAQEEGRLLQSAVPMLTRVTAAAEDAIRCLPKVEALCHNDMDPKNVLWRGGELRIIDLECVGYAHPGQEMLDLAITWGDTEEKFRAFVGAYFAAGGALHGDAALLCDSRRNYIDWLAYNARRALLDDPQERAIAREQIRWTIDKIRDDLDRRAAVLRWMKEISDT